MWGEAIFGIEEENYETDYITQLTMQMNSELPKEEKMMRFKRLYEGWIEKIELSKKQIPIFRDEVARRVVSVEISRIESDLGLYDVMSESRIQNDEFYKVANIFTNLWSKLIGAEKKLKGEIFDKLLVFGEMPIPDEKKPSPSLQGGDYEMMVARILPFLRELFDIFEIITLVVMNCLLQLQAIYNKKSSYYKYFKEFDFFFPLRIIGKGLYLLLCIDTVVGDSTFYESSFISRYWPKYRDSVEMMLADPAKYGQDPDKMKALRRIIVKVDKGIMKGQTLKFFLEHLAKENNMNVFEEMTDFNAIRTNKYILELLKNYFKYAQSTAEAAYSNPLQGPTTQDSEHLSEYLCVFAFYIQFFRVENKDVWRSIWSLQTRVLMVYCHRFAMIRLCDFMMKYCPPKKPYSSLEPKEINSFTVEYLKRGQSSLMNEVIGVYKHLCQWALKMNSMSCSMYVFQTAKEPERIKIFEMRTNQILSGLILARKIRSLIRSSFLIFQKIGYNIAATQIKPLLFLLEMSKKMMDLIEQRDFQLMQDMMVKFSSLAVARILKDFSTRVSNTKHSEKAFYLEAFKALLYLATHYPTEHRGFVSEFCMSFLGVKNIIKDPEVVQFKKTMNDLYNLSTYKQQFRDILDCSYMYWFKEYIPDLIELKTSSDGEFFRLQLFIDALGDCKRILDNAVHLADNSQLVDRYREHIMSLLSSKLVRRVAVSLEEDLVIQSHHFYSVRDLEKPLPQAKFQGDIKAFFNLNKITVLDRIIDLRFLVESSLSESLYNRISDNQRNFDTFEIMRVLAKVKYNLDLGHSYIPSKTIEQGKTDILAIIRSIIFFIQNFKYNMFNQTFIETLNESTRLKAVSINLISDSIKTHGLGVVKGSINLIVEQIHR